MKNLKILLLSSFFVCSCSPDREPEPFLLLHGKYVLISLTSETPVDMNFDGHYDTDWLAELRKVNYVSSSEQFVLDVNDYRIESSDMSKPIFLLHRMPVAFVLQPPNRPIDRIEYGTAFTGHNANHGIDNNEFSNIINWAKETWEGRQRPGEFELAPVFLESIHLSIEEHKLYLRLRHHGVYDAKDDTWRTAYLDAVYVWLHPHSYRL